MSDDNTRKAAILLMSLPQEQAAQLLSKLSPKQVEVVSIEIAKLGRRSFCVALDVRQEDQVKDLVGRTVKEMGRLDVMINNAGASFRAKVEEVLDGKSA